MKKKLLIGFLLVSVLVLAGCTAKVQKAPEEKKGPIYKEEAIEIAKSDDWVKHYLDYFGHGQVNIYATLYSYKEFINKFNFDRYGETIFEPREETWEIVLINNDFDAGGIPKTTEPCVETNIMAGEHSWADCPYIRVYIDKGREGNSRVILCSEYGCNPYTTPTEKRYVGGWY